MMPRKLLLIFLACWMSVASARSLSPIFDDPAPDPAHPPRMEVIHVPSGGVEFNGVVYVAGGPGPHPTFLFFHGIPGNEKNIDLLQAVRRAGWNAISVNYRGSWGSPGTYSLAGNLEDGKAALAYIRDPANARKLDIDVNNIVIAGHSMGGWVTLHTLAADDGVLGGLTISAADFGPSGRDWQKDRAAIYAFMDDDKETLAGVTAEKLTDEMLSHKAQFAMQALAPKLVDRRLELLYSDDDFTEDSANLAKAIKAKGGKLVHARHVTTDHVWSDHRIALQKLVIAWLEGLQKK